MNVLHVYRTIFLYRQVHNIGDTLNIFHFYGSELLFFMQ